MNIHFYYIPVYSYQDLDNLKTIIDNIYFVYIITNKYEYFYTKGGKILHCSLILEHYEEVVNPYWPYYDIVRPYSLVYYVVDGMATFKIYGKTYEFHPNHLYFFPANTPISLINNISENFKITFIHAVLTPELTKLIDIDVGNDKFLGDIVRLLRTYIFQPDTTYLKLLSELLVSYVFDKYDITDSSLCESIKKYIEENYVKVYQNSDLSEVFNYSNSHILKMYKEHFNTTPRHHALSYMLENIMNRLKNGEPIYKISDSLNFSSPENFSKFFKKHLGFPPSHFQKHLPPQRHE